MTSRCPRRCPVDWQTYDAVRTPKDLRLMRAVLFLIAGLLFLAALVIQQYPPYSAGLCVAALLVALAGGGQSAILHTLEAHPGHEPSR